MGLIKKKTKQNCCIQNSFTFFFDFSASSLFLSVCSFHCLSFLFPAFQILFKSILEQHVSCTKHICYTKWQDTTLSQLWRLKVKAWHTLTWSERNMSIRRGFLMFLAASRLHLGCWALLLLQLLLASAIAQIPRAGWWKEQATIQGNYCWHPVLPGSCPVTHPSHIVCDGVCKVITPFLISQRSFFTPPPSFTEWPGTQEAFAGKSVATQASSVVGEGVWFFP